MRKKLLLLPLCLLTLSVIGCQSNNSGEPAQSQSSQQEPSSSKEVITFDAYTLAQLHEVRAAKGLQSLDKKNVSIKGKVTFNKRLADDEATLYIQNGKYAVEVNYSKDFQVNVGDVVEIKGQLIFTEQGEVDTVFLSAYTSVNPDYDIHVINEAIETETVTIKKEADLIEYDSSLASIKFKVTGNRNNAAFVGTLEEGNEEFIVAAKPNVAEKTAADAYKVDDSVLYEGVFTYSGDSSARVLRYLDKAGLSTLK